MRREGLDAAQRFATQAVRVRLRNLYDVIKLCEGSFASLSNSEVRARIDMAERVAASLESPGDLGGEGRQALDLALSELAAAVGSMRRHLRGAT